MYKLTQLFLMWTLSLNWEIIPFCYSEFYQFPPVQARFRSWLLLSAGSVIFSSLAFPLIKVIAKFSFPSCPSLPPNPFTSMSDMSYHVRSKLPTHVDQSSGIQFPPTSEAFPLPIPTVSLQAPPNPLAYLLQLALFLLPVVRRSCQLACSLFFLRKLDTLAVPTT